MQKWNILVSRVSVCIGILFPHLFCDLKWEKKYSSDQEKLLKFEAEGREFAKNMRSLAQFIQNVKGQYNFWSRQFLMGFRNLQEKLENTLFFAGQQLLPVKKSEVSFWSMEPHCILFKFFLGLLLSECKNPNRKTFGSYLGFLRQQHVIYIHCNSTTFTKIYKRQKPSYIFINIFSKI